RATTLCDPTTTRRSSRHYFVRPDDNKESSRHYFVRPDDNKEVVAPLLCATRRQQGGRRATTLCDPTTTRGSSRHYFVRPDDNKVVIAPLQDPTRRRQPGPFRIDRRPTRSRRR